MRKHVKHTVYLGGLNLSLSLKFIIIIKKKKGRPIYRQIFGIFKILALTDKLFCLPVVLEAGLLF